MKVIVEMPRSLRDEALEVARQQDVSLSQVLRMAARAFVAGRLTFSLTEEWRLLALSSEAAQYSLPSRPIFSIKQNVDS
ncbi:MAG TPA: hypothetical protein VEZ40_04515 [Pyrinomonadaceae bacterium]|nr:hypothetical protein [Pyrinomonadaceae bacterium]